MKTIGLTGGIGAGKSTAARILAEFGALVIDADQVGHGVYRPGTTGWQRVVDAFGAEILAADGTIDRKRLGGIVFSDPAQLARLNQLVHPLIADAVKERIELERKRSASRPIVVEAAILIEAKWVPFVDEVWLVVASPDAIVGRVQSQRGLERAAVEARMAAQMSDAERRSHADVVIDNSGTVDALRAQLSRLWRQRVVPSGGTRH